MAANNFATSMAGFSTTLIVVWFGLFALRISLADSTRLEDPDMEYVKRYLAYFGYLPLPLVTPAIDDSRNVTHGLIELQQFTGMEPTGTLDNQTLKLLTTPRCGVRDMDFRISFSSWSDTDLTYRINSFYRNMTEEVVRETIKKAWNMWAEVSTLTFREVTFEEHADIIIDFFSGDHEDGAPFDGPGGVLGHAYPPQSGLAHFDKDEMWSVGTPMNNDSVDLLMVAAHEFGHVLGLLHSDVPESLMFPYYPGYVDDFTLHTDDIQGIHLLYGANPNPEMLFTTPTEPSTTTTKLPMATLHSTTDGSSLVPQMACTGDIDAAVTSQDGSFSYIFTKSFVWQRFSGTELSVSQISQALNIGLPSDVDAALFFRRGVYVFKGCRVWRLNNNNRITNRSNIQQKWPYLPCNIQAAYNSDKDGFTYFFKNGLAYKYRGYQKIRGPVPLNSLGWKNIPQRLPNITAASKQANNRVIFIAGEQCYAFNDRTKRFVNGNWPRSTVPYLLLDCHEVTSRSSL